MEVILPDNRKLAKTGRINITLTDPDVVKDLMTCVEVLGQSKSNTVQKLVAAPLRKLAQRAEDIKAIMAGHDYTLKHEDEGAVGDQQ